MKNMNPNNEEKKDDALLAELLRVSLTEIPTEAFSEKVFTRFLAEKSVKKAVHRPLKIPVIIMMSLAAFLLFPMIPTESTAMTSPTLSSGFSEYLATIFAGINLWYVLSSCLLAIAVMLLIQLEGRRFNQFAQLK